MTMNDLFDAIEEIQHSVTEEGRTAGEAYAQKKHYLEGLELGISQGHHVIVEVGKVIGLMTSLKQSGVKDNLIDKILEQTSSINEWNFSDEECISNKLFAIQAKTRLVLKRLNVASSINAFSADEF